MARRLAAILSADAVGYSRLMAADEAAALRAVDAQRVLLHARVEAHGGRVVDAVGDNLLAELPSAIDAVSCAVEAQRELVARDEALAGPERLELRIGIHVGDVLAEGERIAGDAVNVAARIEALAPPGGVALSAAAHEQVAGRLDLAFEDLGERVLKNIARPVRVLRVAGLGRAQEPSAPLASPGHNLPEPRTRFVGRERELGELEAALAETRLLTLTGIGGAGKSRLSLELARRVLARHPDGVRLVELASQSTQEQIAPAVAQGLGMPDRGFGPAVRRPDDDLCDFVGERRVLLVIDNCEHLAAGVAALADRLLARCPRLRILATSREPLDVPGERLYAVPPLGDAAALLFAERAAAVRSDFRPAEHEAAIREICERLDGIPLAIELAAARAAHLAPREIAARLGHRFELLASRARGEKRHATLRATLDWSHELLEENERILLRRLGVFCDPFSLDAAESVCSMPPLAADAVLDLLASLVRRSLVEPREASGETSYRLIETVREYAREKLAEAGEGDALSARHADWVLAWLRRATPRPFEGMFARLRVAETRSIGDLSAACEWSLARTDLARAPELIALAAPFFVPLARETVAHSALERALALPEGGDPEWRLLLRYLLGRINAIMGRFADSFRVFEALLPELEAAGHYEALSSALVGLSIASESTRLGDPLALLERSIEAARAAANPLVEADALLARGEHELVAGRFAEAVASFDRAAALCASDEGRSHRAASRQALAAVLSGDFERAGVLARAARSAAWTTRSADPSSVTARIDYLLANAAAGDADATDEQMRDAIELQRRLRAPLASADLLAALGGVACLTGDFERAARLLGAARSAFGLHGSWRTNAGGAMYLHFGAQVRRALPADVVKRARDAGRAMSVEEAFELALAMLPPE